MSGERNVSMSREIYTMYSSEKKRIVLTLWRDILTADFFDDDGSLRLLSVTAGEGEICSDELSDSFQQGDIFLFDNGKKFSLKAKAETEIFLVKFNISDFIDIDFKVFSKEVISDFLSMIEKRPKKLCSVHINTKKIQSALYMIENELENKNICSDYVVKAYMGLILSLIIQYFYREGGEISTNRSSHYKNIEKALVYINENLSEKITLDELAQVANMGKTGFSTEFKSITGMTVWEYIINARIELASSYLIEKEGLNVTEISLMCGFNDNAHFAKIFKKIKGSTPREFKKKSNNPCF